MIAAEVLTCDVCHRRIDDLQYAMVFWDADAEDVVTVISLAHKRCDRDRLDLSAELWWMADHETALHRLAELSHCYRWTAEHLQRLVWIAWACPIVGPEHAKGARAWYERRSELGL